MNATQLTMPAAVFQAAGQSPQGLEGSFEADLFVNWSNMVYVRQNGLSPRIIVLIIVQGTYLTLIAKALYFLPHQENIVLQVKTFEPRLWLRCVKSAEMHGVTHY
jgi:hypothetical protein